MPVKIALYSPEAGLVSKSLSLFLVAVASIFMGLEMNSLAYAKLTPHLNNEFAPAECQVLTNKETGETVCFALLSEDSKTFPKNTALLIKGPLNSGVVSLVHLPEKLAKLYTKKLKSSMFRTRCTFFSPPIFESETLKVTPEQYLFEQSQPHSWITKSGKSTFQWVSGPCRIQICSINN